MKQAPLQVTPPGAGDRLTAQACTSECNLMEDNLIHRRDEPAGVFHTGWKMADDQVALGNELVPPTARIDG